MSVSTVVNERSEMLPSVDPKVDEAETPSGKKERDFPDLELASARPVLVVQSPKTPTLSRKFKAVSLDSDPSPKQSTSHLEVSRDVFSMPNTPKRQIRQKHPCDLDDGCSKGTLAPHSSNLKRFASNTSISGSQTLKTLPEIMTLQDFSDNRTEPVRVKAKGLLERRGSNASLTIDLGSNANIFESKSVPLIRLNAAKSISNIYMSSRATDRCACGGERNDRRKAVNPTEACGNCTIYESVPSKTDGCKAKCQTYVHKKCRCLCRCRRKSLSNENLYVPPCGCSSSSCSSSSGNECAWSSTTGTGKNCKGNRKACYPRQPDLEASQLLSEDFKMHLQNVQYLQTASRVLSVDEIKSACEGHRVPKLHREFWEVPLNLQEKCLVSGSQNRNRYRGVLPNEHSRVHLPGPQSYIHANYIKGPDYTETAYIATQGPMNHTCEDFWEMVWFTRCNCIVMLTGLVEKGRSKCELYFPLGRRRRSQEPSFYVVKTTKVRDRFTFDKNNTQQYEEVTFEFEEVDEVTFGRFKISHVGERIFGECTMRELRLSDGTENRTVKHYWFPGWQDHKMANPDEVLRLAELVLEVTDENRKTDVRPEAVGSRSSRAKRSKSSEDSEPKKPVIVHCSAGIGRTGCFLAVLNGIQQLKNGGNVDVLAILCSLRLNRGGSVQTAEQYELVHRVLGLYCDKMRDREGFVP